MPQSLLFDAFRLTPSTGELWRGTEEVKLSPRAAAVMGLLARRSQQVVTKEELIGLVWEGKAVGDDALTSCIQELRRALGDDARVPRFIETRHRRGYKLIVPVTSEEFEDFAVVESTLPMLPDKPSIAVLPFENMSADPDQEYFVDGLVEDIITALSRFRLLFVTARNSSFTYKGRIVDVKQIARELGVRYVLEGSVRKSTARLRITAQLIDASSGAHIWADRFDGTLEDVFKLQDYLTENVVVAIAPRVEQAEIVRARRKHASNLDAYDFYLRGLAQRPLTRAAIRQRLSMFYRAIDLDPEFPVSYGAAVWCYALLKAHGAGTDATKDTAEVERLARIAVSLGQDDAQTLSFAAFGYSYILHDLTTAKAIIEQALTLNANVAAAWVCSGWINIWLGAPAAGIEALERAARLNPVDIPARGAMAEALAHAYFYLGRFEEALSWANQHLREAPDSHTALRIGAASAALAGRDALARKMCAHFRILDPAFRVSKLKRVLGPYQEQSLVDKYAEALRRAGLPE